MVNTNASITNTIFTLANTNSCLSKKVETLTAELAKKEWGRVEVNVRGPFKYWPNWKRGTWHKPDDWFELERNKDKHPRWWKYCLKWRSGTDREGLNASSTNNTYSLISPQPTRSPTIAISGKLPANFIIPLLPFVDPESTRQQRNNKISRKWERRLALRMATKLVKQDRSIVDSIASGSYFTPNAPVSNMNKTAATIRIGTAMGQAQESEASCEFPIPDLSPGLFGHIMSGFKKIF